jgi:hypothetical protein
MQYLSDDWLQSILISFAKMSSGYSAKFVKLAPPEPPFLNRRFGARSNEISINDGIRHGNELQEHPGSMLTDGDPVSFVPAYGREYEDKSPIHGDEASRTGSLREETLVFRCDTPWPSRTKTSTIRMSSLL